MTPEELKAIRLSLGLTASQLGELLRLSPDTRKRTIRAYEAGEKPITGPVSVALEKHMEVLRLEKIIEDRK